MKTYLEYQDDKSNKFWEIEAAGNSFTVRFGRIGADGQTQTKEFTSEQTAQHEAEKLIAEKIKKGYHSASGDGGPVQNQLKPEPEQPTQIIEIPREHIQGVLTGVYGFPFPKDFFTIWEFCLKLADSGIAIVKRKQELYARVKEAFDDCFDLSLGDAFEVFNPDFTAAGFNPLKTDRYFNDPPEFLIIFNGHDDGLHYGYYVDPELTGELWVAHYYHSDSYEFRINGKSLFDALWERLEQMEGRPGKQRALRELIRSCYPEAGMAQSKRKPTVEFYDLGIIVSDKYYQVPQHPLFSPFVIDYTNRMVPSQEELLSLKQEVLTLAEQGLPGAAYALGKRLWLGKAEWDEHAYELLGKVYEKLNAAHLTKALQQAMEFRKSLRKPSPPKLGAGVKLFEAPVKKEILSMAGSPVEPLLLLGLEAGNDLESPTLVLVNQDTGEPVKMWLSGMNLRLVTKVLFDATGQKGICVYGEAYKIGGSFTLSIVDLETGCEKILLNDRKEDLRFSIALLPKENQLLVVGEKLRIYDLASGSKVVERDWDNWEKEEFGNVFSVAVTPDGAYYAVGGLKKGIVRLFDTKTHELVREYSDEFEKPRQIVFDCTGSRLAILDYNSEMQLRGKGIFIWQVNDGTPVATWLKEFTYSCTPCMVLDPSGTRIVTGHSYGYIRIYELDKEFQAPKEAQPLGKATTVGLCYSSDGKTLFAAGKNGKWARMDPELMEVMES